VALSTLERLEAGLGLIPADFELSESAYESRIELWEELAGERPEASETQRQAHIRHLALTGAIASLMRQADKFRAEGDITTEKNILGRVAILQGYQTTAELEAGLVAPVQPSGVVSANPAPEFGEWGIR